MHDAPAISLSSVSKSYRLYNSMVEQALDVFGISRLLFWRSPSYKEFLALKGVDLTIARGERIGIVGRNGAGKTTLLKLITGNFYPSSGDIKVNGTIQALMHVGLGFHPEFTGMENIKASLAYNGLSNDDLQQAIDDVVDFVELGDYLDQPLKSYSAGMEARLMFAAATAIRPDILIVDEVLGAGDAYFSAKSASRMEKLTHSGCTLLLVSHSMQQVLQFCQQVIWIEEGRIVKQGDALEVVKAYEEFTQRIQFQQEQDSLAGKKSVIDQPWFRSQVLEEILAAGGNGENASNNGNDQVNGVSRWPAQTGLKIRSVDIKNDVGESIRCIRTGEKISLEITIYAEESGEYEFVCNVLLFTEDGKPLSRHISDRRYFSGKKDEETKLELFFQDVCLGNGEYVISVALFKEFDPEMPSNSLRYDLLSRSFSFKVMDKYRHDPSVFHHPSVWR